YKFIDQLEYIVFGINNLTLSNTSLPLLNDETPTPTYYKIMNFNNNKNVILYYLNTLLQEVELKEINYELACKSILTLFIIYISRNSESTLLITSNPEKLNIE